MCKLRQGEIDIESELKFIFLDKSITSKNSEKATKIPLLFYQKT